MYNQCVHEAMGENVYLKLWLPHRLPCRLSQRFHWLPRKNFFQKQENRGRLGRRLEQAYQPAIPARARQVVGVVFFAVSEPLKRLPTLELIDRRVGGYDKTRGIHCLISLALARAPFINNLQLHRAARMCVILIYPSVLETRDKKLTHHRKQCKLSNFWMLRLAYARRLKWCCHRGAVWFITSAAAV